MIEEGRLHAYADDILLAALDEEELESAINEIERIFGENGMSMNKDKCEIFTDRKITAISEKYEFTNPELTIDLDGAEYMTELCGIKFVPYVKYLGVIIACDRKAVIAAAKHKCMKYVKRIGSRAITEDEELNKLVRCMYFESLLRYHLTPLVAAGLMNKEAVR